MIRKVILDAGHGGYDAGDVHAGRLEKEDNLHLVLKVGNILKENGVEVFYIRDSDKYIAQSARANMANKEGGDLILSIHRNSTRRPDTYSGAIAYVNKEDGLEEIVAMDILQSLKKECFNNLGVQIRDGINVLDKTKLAAILLEVGFINTSIDNECFDKNLDGIAAAIADGILSFNKMEYSNMY